MKRYMNHFINHSLRNVLCACMILSCWFGLSTASVLFFGEYPYPSDEE